MTTTNSTSLLVFPLVFSFIFFFNQSFAKASIEFNVVKLGAKPDGKTDSTKAFTTAWELACGSTKPAKIYVPIGRYLIKQARFNGKCNNKAIRFQIDGTLVAPSDYNSFIGNDGYYWIQFQQVEGVSIHGGKLDGKGSGLWACKNSSNKCPSGATTLGFSDSNNIKIRGLTFLNSQLYHIVIIGCHNVKVQAVKILALGDSPNTDGIHVQSSSRVTIVNSKISTGDDCISIGPGTNNLWIENIFCGPGHGISIGSLGKDFQEDGVQNVTVKRAKFKNTQNGVRIKTWGRPSSSFVKHVAFLHVSMIDVNNPIIIDQNYCPDNENCPSQWCVGSLHTPQLFNKFSGVKISDVTYQDIHGTSASQVAVKFDCSKANPCKGIKMENVKLTYNKDQQAQASCVNAAGVTSGLVEPSSCL